MSRVISTFLLVFALSPWCGIAVEPQATPQPSAPATAPSPSSRQDSDLHALGGLWKDDRIFVAFTAPISAADVATMTINGAVVPWVIVSDGRGALSTSTFRQGPYLVAWGNEQVQLVDHEVAAPQVLLYEAPNRREVPESPTGQTQSFQGHRVDPETGFVYLRNRYYDPEMGMFITADPMGFPDGPSPYAFGAGDPVNGRDPFGLFEGAEIRQRQYEAYRSGIDPMYMRGAADQIDLILADPRFQGTMQMLGGCSEAAVGALAAGGTAGLAAVPGGIAMLHGADLCGAGYRTLRSGSYQQPLTVLGMQTALLRAGLSPERAYLGAQIFDAVLGGAASAYSTRQWMIPPVRPFPRAPIPPTPEEILAQGQGPLRGLEEVELPTGVRPPIFPGFRSFSAFKRFYGPAGPGKQWHHIVEQNPANLAKFGPEALHTMPNMIPVDVTTHYKINGFYSELQPGTNGLTVRKWLSTQSLPEQREFGLSVLRRFGVIP